MDCIHLDPEDRMCYIEPNDCIDCNVCEAACPVGAIFADNQVPGEAALFTEINALWFKDKEAARSQVDAFMQDGINIT